MNKNKKSRPGDCSTRTATETGTTCETASSPAFYDTMFRAGGQTGISSLLMHGAKILTRRRRFVKSRFRSFYQQANKTPCLSGIWCRLPASLAGTSAARFSVNGWQVPLSCRIIFLGTFSRQTI